MLDSYSVIVYVVRRSGTEEFASQQQLLEDIAQHMHDMAALKDSQILSIDHLSFTVSMDSILG